MLRARFHTTSEFGVYEQWQFNYTGSCVSNLRRLVPLWMAALHGAGGMSTENVELMH